MSWLKGSQGAVSLLTVSIVSLLILVLTIGMASLTVGVLQQASDAENQTVAYYNAEAAAEMAVTSVKSNLQSGTISNINTSSCQGNVTSCSAKVCGYPLPGQFGTSDTLQISISSARLDPLYSSSNGICTNPNNDTSHPATSLKLDNIQFSDPGQYLELTMTSFVRVNGSEGFPATRTIYLCQPNDTTSPPTCQGGSATSSASFFGGSGGTQLVILQNQGCSANSYCITLGNLTPDPSNLYPTNPNGWRAVLRATIHSGKLAAPFQLTPYDAAGETLVLDFPTANIDAESQSGDSFSRVNEQVQIASGFPSDVGVLYGDQSLCKTFQDIYNGQTDVNGGKIVTNVTPGAVCP